MWQDYVLTAVQIAFCITLFPMLLDKEKPPLISSIPTGLIILIMAATVATLHLWLAAVSQSIVGIQWLILAYQKWHASRRATLVSVPI